MNPEQAKPCPSQTSALQVLSLSDIEEGMEHNLKRAQELQQDLTQKKDTLEQELADAQVLQGKEALLADF